MESTRRHAESFLGLAIPVSHTKELKKTPSGPFLARVIWRIQVRKIPASAKSPLIGVKLGSLLADLGRQAMLSDDEFAVFEQARNDVQANVPSPRIDQLEANSSNTLSAL